MAVPTKTQISAGGVVFRRFGGDVQVALIAVATGDGVRWQLPKGIVNSDEGTEETALREVREETGLDSVLIGPIDTIDYWYYGSGGSVRFHKYVHFFLLRYQHGSTADHDDEVVEARWVMIDEAKEMLAFKSEQGVLAQAVEMIAKLGQNGKTGKVTDGS